MSVQPTNGKSNGKALADDGTMLAQAMRVHDASMRPAHRLPGEKLAEWIREKSSPDQGEFRACVFLLQHDHEDHGPRPLTPARLPKSLTGKAREKRIERIVAEFDDASFEYAKRFARTQGFIVGALAKDGGAAQAEAQFPFNVSPPADVADEMHQRGSEVNSAAIIGHLTRVNEKKDQLAHESAQRELDRMLEIQLATQERLDRLEERSLAHAIRAEEALNEKAKRDIEVQRSEFEFGVQKELAFKLLGFIGAVAEKYVDGKKAKAPAAEQTTAGAAVSINAYEQAVQAIEPAKVVALADGLTSEQKALAAPVLEFFLGALPPAKRREIMQAREAAGVEPPKEEGTK